MSYMTQNACDKTNALPKMKNFTEHTMICIHYLVWGYNTRYKQRYSEKKFNAKKFRAET